MIKTITIITNDNSWEISASVVKTRESKSSTILGPKRITLRLTAMEIKIFVGLEIEQTLGGKWSGQHKRRFIEAISAICESVGDGNSRKIIIKPNIVSTIEDLVTKYIDSQFYAIVHASMSSGSAINKTTQEMIAHELASSLVRAISPLVDKPKKSTLLINVTGSLFSKTRRSSVDIGSSYCTSEKINLSKS